MAKNESQANSTKETQVDDFKTINGIKQGIESRLHAAGVLTYDQLASLTPEDVLAALGKVIGYTSKRIIDEDWIGQARKLAQNAPNTEERMIRQHYATFTIELLLGEENDVRRTKMVHLQGDIEETWAGWDETRLVGFITRSAHMQVVEIQAAAPFENKDQTPDQLQMTKHAEEPPAVVGLPQMRELAIISPATGERQRVLAQGQPFDIDMTLDMTDVQAPAEESLSFQLTAFAKALGSGSRQVLDSAQGSFAPGKMTTLQLKSSGLPGGTYRIGIDFIATAPSSPVSRNDLAVFLEGGLIKVY